MTGGGTWPTTGGGTMTGGGTAATSIPPRHATHVALPHGVGEPACSGPDGRELGSAPGSGVGPVRSDPRAPEELGKPPVRLEIPSNHHRVVRLERPGYPIHERPREAERIPNFPDGGSSPVRDEVADHAGVLGPVSLIDILDHLFPTLG